MAYEFRFPDVGEGIAEGEIVKWLVKEGNIVKEHDVIVKIETSKAIVDIPSPRAGTVLRINFKEGQTVKVGEVLAVIGEKSEKLVPKETAVAPAAAQRGVAVVGELEEAKTSGAICNVCNAQFANQQALSAHIQIEHKIKSTKEVLAMPAVRQLAKQLNVDLTKISGAGLSGRITEDDVRNAAKSLEAQVAPILAAAPEVKVTKKYDFFGFVERVPLKSVRKVTAEHMLQAVRTAAYVTHMDEIDVTDLWHHREQQKTAAAEQGIKLTFLPFVVKALVAALKLHPYANAAMDEQTKEIILKKYYNIGIAVDVEDGLIVPVVKIADQKDVFAIAKEIQGLAERAKTKSLDLMDMRGSTFTVTNIGSLGGLFATPIPNFPDVAILGLGRIHDKVVPINGKIEIRKILPASLTFDHRVFDGAEAARFVNDLKKFLEDIGTLL